MDEHIINAIKAQAHKYPLPAEMVNSKKQIKLNETGHIEQMNKTDFTLQEYINKVKGEVFKNPNIIDSWIQEAENNIDSGSYKVFVNKDSLFYDVQVKKTTGNPAFDAKMINLIKSKSGIIPLPEKYTLGDCVFTLNLNLKQN